MKVNVDDIPTGITAPETDAGKNITCDGRDIVFHGFDGELVEFYTLTGAKVLTISVDDEVYIDRTGLVPGTYVLHCSDGMVTKIVIR